MISEDNRSVSIFKLLFSAFPLCRDSEKEWYYTGKDKERQGPYSFKEMRDLWTEQEIHQRSRYVHVGGYFYTQASLFLPIVLACTTKIYTHEFNIACMHACCRKAATPQKPF